MTKKKIDDQAKAIMRLAEESGVENNYFFTTTFERYQVQLQILKDLEQSMQEDGMLVKKEYVKGRKNLYSNPAVTAYNKTADSANKTVATLMRIIKNFGVEEQQDEVDPLMSIINGGDENDEQ